jgi:hypothetical protein
MITTSRSFINIRSVGLQLRNIFLQAVALRIALHRLTHRLTSPYVALHIALYLALHHRTPHRTPTQSLIFLSLYRYGLELVIKVVVASKHWSGLMISRPVALNPH